MVFATQKNRPSKKIQTIINQALETIKESNISKILMQNPLEKLVPFNLWFHYPKYRVMHYFQNNQHIRTRYLGNSMLTPLVTMDNTNFSHIKSLVNDLSLYQPFYPETFYGVWEFLQTKYLMKDLNKFLHIGREDRLGSMEAIIFYHERYQQTYQTNQYHCWISGKETYEEEDFSYRLCHPEVDYLGQAYHVKFLRSTNDLVNYNFISIDANHLFDHVFRWSEEELDLHADLFYLITAVEHLDEGGCILIKLNLIGSASWTILFDVAYCFFKEYIFIRPTMSNPFNSEVYLFLNKIQNKSEIKTFYHSLLKNLYRQRIHLNLFLEPIESDCPIAQKYIACQELWAKKLLETLKTFSNSQHSQLPNNTTDWHKSNDLKQIKDLSAQFNPDPMMVVLRSSAKKLRIGLDPLDQNFVMTVFYRKLVTKRAELNYYKRVMDTKPSKIFTEIHQKNPNQYLFIWEQLVNQLDIFHDLKYILGKQYNVETPTNAWTKMFEMLSLMPTLVPTEQTRIKTFHLCEAPGAFISATGHYLSSRNIDSWEWYGQTLRPTNTGSTTDAALEDHFGLIATHPDKWLFGPETDNSGDITHSAIIKYYASHPKLKDIDFMTADAGLHCHPRDLNEQESFLGKINMGQIVCILACLPVGKSALFKTFLPMTEPLTISLMYLLAFHFENVTIVKPSTSHSSNSEVYVALGSYKGIKKTELDLLYYLLDDPTITTKILLFEQLAVDSVFCKSYTKIITSLIDRQIQSLSRNYYYYYHYDEVPSVAETAAKYTEAWLRRNPIPMLKWRLL